MEKDTDVWLRRAALLFCFAVGVLLAVPTVRFVFPVLFPFVLSWCLAHCVLPAAERISGKTGIPQRSMSVILLLSVLLLLVCGIGFLGKRLLAELKDLVTVFLQQEGGGEDLFGAPLDALSRILERLGIDAREGEAPRAWFRELAGNALSRLGAMLPDVMGRLITALPSFLFSLFVTVIAGFYFCMDPQMPIKYLPDRWRREWEKRSAGVKRLLGRFWRAYLLLWLITLGELWVGFLMLRVPRALLLALAVSLVDILPVLGVGTVLIPWAVFAFLQRNYFLGFGLALLYLAVSLIRQVMEPRLVGKSLGMPPLLTLIASYAGWRWFGVAGAVLAPFAILLLRVPVELLFKMIKSDKGQK